MRRSPGPLVCLLSLALLLAAPGEATAAHPFYTDLLRQGIQAYHGTDYPAAIDRLRIACFGFLEEPELLAEGLTWLALAQVGQGDREGFYGSFRRIAELEQRFRAYGQAPLPPGPRREFEERVIQEVPGEVLAASRSFVHLYEEKIRRRLAQLPTRERRGELEKLLAQDPDRPLWHLMKADLELAEGWFEAAYAAAQTVLQRQPGQREALCLRGSAQARIGRCEAAVRDLEGCDRIRLEKRFAVPLLECWLTLGRGQDADRFLGSLPEALRADREIARLAQQTGSGPSAEGGSGAPPTQNGAEPPTDGGAGEAQEVTVTSEPAEPVGPSAEERADLARARELLRAARQAQDLAEPDRLARRLADAHPEWRQAQHLAAEIAYRASRWAEAVSYFRRGGDPGDDQPALLFYMAVALFEAGERQAAATALRRSLPALQRTPYVESYIRKILGGAPDPRSTGAAPPNPPSPNERDQP